MEEEMIRLTATEKWGKGWFCNLTPTYKLFFIYLCENCNNAGIWEVNWAMVKFHVWEEGPLDPSIFGLNEDGKPRVVALSETKWFIRTFVLFQQKINDLNELKPEYGYHKQIIQMLQKEKIIDQNLNEASWSAQGALKEGSHRGLGIGIGIGLGRASKKEGVKGKETKRKFVKDNPPTLEEVVAYAVTRGNKVDPQYFYDKNTGMGWVDKHKVPYTDWKAVYRTWEAYKKETCTQAQTNTKRPVALVVAEMVAAKKTNHEILHELVGKYTEHAIHEAIDKIRGTKT